MNFKAILTAMIFATPVAAQEVLVEPVWILPAQHIGCDGKMRSYTWTAARDTYFKELFAWNGLDYGHFSDVPFNIYRKSDGAPVAIFGHDDYINGGSIRNQRENWGGATFKIAAGDGLVTQYMCSADYKPPHTGGFWVVGYAHF